MVVLVYRTLTDVLGSSDAAFDAMYGHMTMHGYGSLDGLFQLTHIWDHYPEPVID